MTTESGRFGIPLSLLLALALLSSVAPFSTDLYLSAFPVMADDLGTSDTVIQLTLTSFLIGLAAGQLVFGPLSDRVGRRRPLLIGASVLVLASIATAMAPSIEFLIGARLLQGLGGAAGMVLGRAIVADRVRGDGAARVFSLMMIVGAVAPIVAPVVGSLLVDVVGWRGVLAVLAVLAIAILLVTWFVVAESHPPERRGSAGLQGIRELGGRAFVAPAVAFVFAFSVMMAYISASPFLYQEVIGWDAVTYGAVFGVNALGMVGASAAATRMLRTMAARHVLGLGLAGVLAATTAVLALSIVGVDPAWLPLPLFVVVASLGMVLGPATGVALSSVPAAAGTASAVLGALQFGVAAVLAPLVSFGGSVSTVTSGLVMFGCALIAAIAYLAVPRIARPA